MEKIISDALEQVIRGNEGISNKTATELYVLLFSKRLISRDTKQKKLNKIKEIFEDEWKLNITTS